MIQVSKFTTIILVFFLFISCNNDKQIADSLKDYTDSGINKNYHFGDKIILPQNIIENSQSISVSFGDEESAKLTITPELFNLGDNYITYNVKLKDGKTIMQDATIKVFATVPEKIIPYEVVNKYPHDPNHFLEGLYLEGNTVYESVGLTNASKLIKYHLGSKAPLTTVNLPAEMFAEGCAVVGNKIYQLTYRNRKGFIYDKSTFQKISEFTIPDAMREGWGLTFDGNDLIATDGSNTLYFLDVDDPSKIVKTTSVAGYITLYDQLNELEFHNGYLYSNVWFQPIVLKINPSNGEVVGKFDFTEITTARTIENREHVLNGIAFKDENMLVSGKNWSEIYEISIK